MANFKKSLEFQRLVSDRALRYYYHSYRTYISQFADASYLPLTTSTSFLDIHVGLANVPEPDKEVLSQAAKKPYFMLPKRKRL
ncbi:UNVERIFIED_CONTAM: hypothetical protein Sradi_3874200 [Sesamum radiatum]|uniref:Uncharacterized protein n=1 Tax=Sesamum radiatum TaxID=300843 RepID=A0AAW2Q2B9_SESRA